MTYQGLMAWLQAVLNLPVYVGLMVSDTTPSLETKETDVTIDTSYGLLLQRVVWGTAVVSRCGVQCPAVPNTFTVTSTPSGPITVYGYCLLSADEVTSAATLIACHRFSTPQVLSMIGDSVVVNPIAKIGGC